MAFKWFGRGKKSEPIPTASDDSGSVHIKPPTGFDIADAVPRLHLNDVYATDHSPLYSAIVFDTHTETHESRYVLRPTGEFQQFGIEHTSLSNPTIQHENFQGAFVEIMPNQAVIIVQGNNMRASNPVKPGSIFAKKIE